MKKMLNELVRYGKFAFALAFALCCFNASATAITPADYFAKKVDFTIGGYLGTSTLANFPVLVKLSTASVSGLDYSACGTDGANIRFIDADNNLLPFEIDTWNPSGESFIWVSVPSLSGMSTKITMCYGANGSTCPPAGGNVWALANYKSVWHMDIVDGDSNTKVTSDSVASYSASVMNHSTTANAYCGAGTGLIGGGYYCNANNKQYGVHGDSASYAGFAATTVNTFTYTAWAKQIGGQKTADTDTTAYPYIGYDSGYGNCGVIWHTGNSNGGKGTGIEFNLEGQNSASQFGMRDSDAADKPSLVDIHDNKWHYTVVRYDGGTRTIWIDGVKLNTKEGASHTNPAGDIFMGARKASGGDTTCIWTGDLDEMRFRDAASSDDWLAAEYANVTSTSFMSNNGAKDIVDEPLALGWTAEPMSANGDTIRTDGVFKYGYARNDVNAVGQYTVNGETFTALHDGGDFRNTDKNPNVVVSPGDFDWVDGLGDEGASGDYGKMLANAFGSKNLKGDYTFTLKNLEAGKTYLVQVVAHRTGQSYPVTSPDSTKVIYAGGTDWTYGGSLICVFDANTTEYSFTLNYGTWIMLNAIQVRELGDAPVKPAPWDSEHGPFAKRIAFTASGYEGSETLENFPVLVRLSTAISGFNYTDCGTNGANIQFADDNGHVLPYEIDTWNASGESLIWVNVASLSRGARFYMYFGGTPSAANISTSTWNSNYVGVWHLNETGYNGTVADSTAHGLNGTIGNHDNGVYDGTLAAPIGNARWASHSNVKSYTTIPSYNSYNVGDTFTVSGWFKMDAASGYPRLFSRKDYYADKNGWEIEMYNGTANKFDVRGAAEDSFTQQVFPVSLLNGWAHVAFVYNGTTVTAYQNGVWVASGTITAATDNNKPMGICCDSDGSETAFTGAYDECRLLDAVASADWVKAEYQQSAKPEFLVAGAVETHVASTYTVSWTGGENATVAATVDSTPINTGDSVEDGKTVCFTVTPDNGYEFASAPTGWELSSGNLTKNVTVSGAAITETIPSATAIIYPFYIGGTGYDTWADAYAAVSVGGTIKVGNDYKGRIDAYTSGKSFTIDLNGKILDPDSGWISNRPIVVVDTAGNGVFKPDGANFNGSELDLSALNPEQITSKVSANYNGPGTDTTVVIFPASMTVEQCIAKVEKQGPGTKIVVQGVTYTWDGTAWVAGMTGDYYVSPNGDDSNSGTSRNAPFKTIQKALEEADKVGGKTIVALRGTYEINPTSDVGFTLKSGNTLIAEEGREVTFIVPKPGSSSWERCIKIDGTGAEKLIGFTITGFSGSVRGTAIHMTKGTVSWCCISNNATAFTGSGTYYGSAVSILSGTIDHTIVANNTGNLPGAGIGATSTTGDILLDTCLIYGNGMSGGKEGTGGVKIQFSQTCACVIRNCTIVGNTSSGDHPAGLNVGSNVTDAHVVLVNDIISGNLRGGSATDELNVRFESANDFDAAASKNCLISGNIESTSTGKPRDASIVSQMSAAGFIGTAPTFIGAGDYHLAAGSAGIAAGASYDGIGVDLDNKAFAATPSMGCYEYDGVAPTTYAVTWSGAENATVSAKVDGAAITSGAMVANGKSVVFTVTPNSGYQFTSASDGWTLSGSSLSGTFTLDGSALAVTIPNATAIPSTDPVVPSIGSVSASVSADQKSVTITIDNVVKGTDASGSNPAQAYDVKYKVKNAGGTEVKSSTPLTGRTATSVFFSIGDFSESGTYTCEVWIENNQGVPSERVTSDQFTVVSDSDEPVLEPGWTASSLTADPACIRTDGYPVYAYARGDFTINTVAFKDVGTNVKVINNGDIEWSLDGSILSSGGLSSNVIADDDYRGMLNKGWTYHMHSGNQTSTLRLKNLISGNRYLVQIVGYGPNEESCSQRVYATESNDPSICMRSGNYQDDTAWPLGGTLVGVFVADSTVKDVELKIVDSNKDWITFNAVQLRDLSDPEHVSIESIKEAYSISGEPTATQIRTGIQAAIDRAAPAHMPVYLEAGTYMIDDQLNVTNGVQLIGAGMDQTIIDRGLSPAAMSSLDWKIHRCVYIDDGAKIEGMTVKGAAIGNKNAGGAVWVKNGTVSWCHVCENFAYSANVFGAGISFEAGQGTADHCIVDHNILGDTGNTAQGMCGAVGIANTTGSVLIDTCLVASNTVYASGNSGIYVETATGKTSVGKWVIRNCTVVGNSSKSNAGGIVSYTINGGGQLTLANNIVVGNFLNGAEKNISLSTTYLDATTSTNNFYGLQSEAINTITGSSLYGTSINGGNSRFGDPGFVDAEHGNYHLNDCSLAAGAGVSYAGLGVDLAGVAFANPPSIGCYEYNGTGIQPVAGNATATRQGIQAAIDAVAPAHGTVHLGVGLFELDQQLMVTNGVTLTGKGMDATILKYVGAANTANSRVATLSDRATLSHVAVTGANATGFGAVKIAGTESRGQEGTAGGTISWCSITNNVCGYAVGSGVGISGGGYVKIDHAIVANNTSTGKGAIGSEMLQHSSTGGRLYLDVDTCLVAGNKTTGYCAGIYVINKYPESEPASDLEIAEVKIHNTTIAGNQVTAASSGAGGLYTTQKNTTLTNCIFSDNSVANNGLDPNVFIWSASASSVAAKTSYCFFGNGTTPFGTDAVSSEGSVRFKSAENGDYRLAELSPAIDAGRMTAEMEVDLNGEAWATPPSIGCYEYDGENVDAPVFSPASGTRSYPEIRVTLACATDGATIRYTTDGSEPTTENGTVYGGGTINLSTENPVTVKARAFKVGVEPSGIVTAYYNGLVLPVAGDAATTRKTIQDAIDEAAALSPAGTVYLGEGLFLIDAQLMVTGGVTLAGQSMKTTIIKQTTSGTESRCATLNNGSVIKDLTLTGGNMTGNWNYGAGVCIEAGGGTVSWCCVSNNVCGGNNLYGGGINVKGSCVIDHTVVAFNKLTGNTGYGAGIGGYNEAKTVVIDTCLIYGNEAKNSTSDGGYGGGVCFRGTNQGITIRNSTIVNNEAVRAGAGVVMASMNGTSPVRLLNCIVSGNMNGLEEDNVDASLATGSSNNLIGEDPLFEDPGKGDYHLVGGSPAAGTGMWYDGIVEDLDGNEREVPVAIGCYNGSSLISRPVFDFSVKGRGVGTNSVVVIGEDVASYTVSYAYGPVGSVFADSDYHVINSAAGLNDELSVTMTGLATLETYAYSYKVVENGGAEPATYVINGKFSTPDWKILKLSRPKAEPYSKGAEVSVSIMRLGDGATVADVSVQWGLDYDHLCVPVHLTSDAVEGEVAEYEIGGLQNGTQYVYQFVAFNDAGDEVVAKGTFTTLPPEGLVLSEPKASELTESSVKLSTTLVTVGEDAETARVVLKWGTAPDALSNSVTLDEAATRGSTFTYTIDRLSANTLYYYAFVATNDLNDNRTESGSFMTDDPALETASRSKNFPTNPGTGKVVTFDADAAGDPSSFVPGSPYCVVDSAGYEYPYSSTVGSGQSLAFRNETDFQYNCSARRYHVEGGVTNVTYYLFLSDAVDAAQANDTIELLRNNYAIGETMVINKKLSILGNGYTVKVAYPFAEESGYVNPTCTTTPKTVFRIDDGGDVYLEDMQVMGGGENLTGTSAGSNDVTTPAIVVGKYASGKNEQTGSTGILQMDHVTVTRSQGGLIVCEGTKVYLEACNLVRNVRYCGGGIYNHGFLVMVSSSLSENRSLNGAGGGAAMENQGELFLNNCVVCNNASTEYGGAINNLMNTGTAVGGDAYVLNTTFAGNITSHTKDYGGGIGTHAGGKDFYMVNTLLCNNYWYHNSTFTVSDFMADAGSNYLLYSVIGSYTGDYMTEILGGDQIDVEASGVKVFKSYTTGTRVYQNANDTTPLTSVKLENDPEAPLARYAPLDENDSPADIGTDGVYTYFDASGWRDGVVKMSYKTANGSEMMQVCDKYQVADVSAEVTTYYETAFVPNVSDRELGVVGASGFGTTKKMYELKLVKKPEYGSASKNLTLGGTSYKEGASVTVIATPDAACTFIGWYDELDTLKSEDTSYTFVMDSDKKLYPKFTPPAKTYTFLNIECEQAYSATHAHGTFSLTVTTNWLDMAFGANGMLQKNLAPGGIVTDANVSQIEALLNTPDAENGLNHIWQNYVLGGLKPHDPKGRIWIQADQVQDSSQLKFFANELGKTLSCGFDVQYRLASKEIGTDDDFKRTDSYWANSTFESEPVGQDKLKYRVIDMIFIPDGYKTSWEYVTTVNTAGVLKVESDKKVEILASPFVGFSPSNNPPITATLYAKASCLSKDDVLYVYDRPNSNYLAWAVGGEKTWEVKDTYLIKDGVVQYQHEADASRTNSLDRGLGAWLERKDPKSPIYLFGQVDPTPVETTLEAGFNLVGNPYPYEFDASQLPPGVDENDKPCIGMYGDHIVIPTGGAPINSFYQKESWGYYKEIVIDDEFFGPIVTSEWVTEGLTLPIGHGFWYNNTSGKSAELEWSKETK